MASELRVDKIIPVDGVPSSGGGGIVQIVKGGSNSRLDRGNNTGTYYNTYVNATITPKFNTSKILIVGTGDVQAQNDTTGAVGFARGDTAGDGNVTNGTLLGVTSSAGIVNFRFNATMENVPLTAMYLDSPGTTSATKYTVILARVSGYNNILLPGNNNHNEFSIYLFEVSA